jgi:hypothetical protein
MCAQVSYKTKICKKNLFWASLKSLKKGVGSGVESGSGAGSISHRYRSEDPDPHQNVTDPQHWLRDIDGWIIKTCLKLMAMSTLISRNGILERHF